MFDQLNPPRLMDRKEALNTEQPPQAILSCNKGDVAVVSQGVNLVCFTNPDEAIRVANMLLGFAQSYVRGAA